MTQAARAVLSDCKIALQMLEEEVDLARWRINWAGTVSLLRTVGYVLHKVDGEADPAIKKLSNAAFKQWNSSAEVHEIFREFIERERNFIVKEYRLNVHPLDEVDVAVELTLQPLNGGPPIKQVQVFPIGDNIYRPITDGFREGDDARDVVSDAIDWWDSELSQIEKEYAATRRGDPQ